MHNGVLLGILVLWAAPALQAQLVSEALSTFPPSTESFEYNNLASLRMLPHFDSFQQQFSSKPLELVNAALGKLDIEQDQVTELAIGSSKGVTYGLLSGAFSGSLAAKVAVRKSIRALKLEDRKMYCPGGGVCLVFLEDWLLAFGPPDQLNAMLQAREGTAASLGANPLIAMLMNATDGSAPVRGIAPGSRFNLFLSDGMRSELGVALDLSEVSASIEVLAYSVTFDKAAHIKAALECRSPIWAAVLRQTLWGVGQIENAKSAGKPLTATSFQNVDVGLSGSTIRIAMDTVWPLTL